MLLWESPSLMRYRRLSSTARPDDALASRAHFADAFEHELLQPLTFVRLGRVEIPFGIGGDAVHAVELTRLAPAVAKVGELFHRVAEDDAHLLVRSVGEEEVALLRVLRKRDVP